MKPWDPPEERLYPVLDDLLEDWRAAVERARPDADGDAVSVIGAPLLRESQRVRDLLREQPDRLPLARRRATSPRRRLLAEAALGADRLPVVLAAGRRAARRPPTRPRSPRESASRRTEELALYDLVVVGAGPAGPRRGGLRRVGGPAHRRRRAEGAGGQAGTSSRIENYLGFPAGLSGRDLARRATTQARRFGAELLTAQRGGRRRRRGTTRVVRLADGTEIALAHGAARAGVSYRRLDVAGRRRADRARASSTARRPPATRALLDGQEAFVVGGANSAGQAALHSPARRSVTILYRGESLREVDVAVPRRPHRGDARGDHGPR